MKRLALAILLLSVGTGGLGMLHQATRHFQTMNALRCHELHAACNQLTELNKAIAMTREEVARKKALLAAAPVAPKISPELLELLTGNASSKSHKRNLAGWDELREQLGIAWNNSEDYVLVSKPVLNRFNFRQLYTAERASDTATAVFALSPQEQAGLADALHEARQAAISRVQRVEPTGDVVAQYTIQPNPAVQATLSNQFSTEITGILGTERSDLFLPAAWRELKPELTPDGNEPVTMTIRRSAGDGDLKLIWELSQGTSVSSGDVRYAYYPSTWFLTLFPGGWESIAAREGFELPKSFRNQAGRMLLSLFSKAEGGEQLSGSQGYLS